MEATVSAIYEQGALRLLTPVSLPESSKVQVRIQSAYVDTSTGPNPDPTQPGTVLPEAIERILESIRRLFAHFETESDNQQVRELFPELFQAELRLLWHHSIDTWRTLSAMLQLSANHIQANAFGEQQIDALNNVLDRFAQPSLTDDDIRTCHEELTAAGLPPSLALDAKSVQSYLDEL